MCAVPVSSQMTYSTSTHIFKAQTRRALATQLQQEQACAQRSAVTGGRTSSFARRTELRCHHSHSTKRPVSSRNRLEPRPMMSAPHHFRRCGGGALAPVASEAPTNPSQLATHESNPHH